MISIKTLKQKAEEDGYRGDDINAKVSQDILLKAISMSPLCKNVTVKGGVVMRSITGDSRRATRDMDIDFIHFSLSDEAIDDFLKQINRLETIAIERIGRITDLSHQDYVGKRIHVRIRDSEGNILRTKIDLGVHKQSAIAQKEYSFDVVSDSEGAVLLINSFAQIFAEKLKSLLRFGEFSTRYKDIFDMYYLKDRIDLTELNDCLEVLIYGDKTMMERSVNDIVKRLKRIEGSKDYVANLRNARYNWLDVDPIVAFDSIIVFLQTCDKTE